jgi:hypothetical protein
MKLYLGTCDFIGRDNREVAHFLRIAWADDIEEARRKFNSALVEVIMVHGYERSTIMMVTEAL